MAKRNYAKRDTKEFNFFTELCQIIAVYGFVMPYVFLFYRIKVEGIKNIPKGKSFIVAPTHSGYLDPELVSYATKRPIAYMAKKELYEIPWLCPIIAALGTFAVNREKLEIATIRTAQAVMKTNKWLLSLFPQGTRDLPRKITTINQGFAYLARAAKADVLPITITGTEKFSKIPFGGKIVIKIGKPFPASKDLAETMENWCNAVVELDGFEITQSAKAEIQRIREKKDKNESSNSES